MWTINIDSRCTSGAEDKLISDFLQLMEPGGAKPKMTFASQVISCFRVCPVSQGRVTFSQNRGQLGESGGLLSDLWTVWSPEPALASNRVALSSHPGSPKGENQSCCSFIIFALLWKHLRATQDRFSQRCLTWLSCTVPAFQSIYCVSTRPHIQEPNTRPNRNQGQAIERKRWEVLNCTCPYHLLGLE